MLRHSLYRGEFIMFLKKLIKKSKNCPCCLRGTKDDPHRAAEDGYFDLIQTVPYDPPCSINDYYILRCKRCGVTYQVFEREYHYLWWEWHRLEGENPSTKKQYPPIEGQKWWEKVLDQITRRENFKWSIFSLILYTVFLFLAVYIPANILARPDIADILFDTGYRTLPFVIAVAFINPLSGLWSLWAECKLQQPIKDFVAKRGNCTYSDLVTQVMPIKIHLGMDDALELLLRTHELVLKNERYHLPTQNDRERLRKEGLLAYDIRISFEELEKLFSLDSDTDDGNICVGFSLISGSDYWLWKCEDEMSGTTRFFFSSDAKEQHSFSTFHKLAESNLFDGQSLRSVWDDAVLTFFNDHEDIEWWLEKYLY